MSIKMIKSCDSVKNVQKALEISRKSSKCQSKKANICRKCEFLFLYGSFWLSSAGYFYASIIFLGACPLLCGGHGDYKNGECICHPGWKGKECSLRHDECEVADCSGRGRCSEGHCQCIKGFTGEFCQKGKNMRLSLAFPGQFVYCVCFLSILLLQFLYFTFIVKLL